MPVKNDNSSEPGDWTNRKLIRIIRDHITGDRSKYSLNEREATMILDEIEKRFVRSSSRN